MNGINKRQVVSVIQRSLIDFKADEVVRRIAEVFLAPTRVFLVGGFIRDVVLHSFYHIHTSPRDLDFVVFDLEADRLYEYTKSLGHPQPTTLGGAKVRIGEWSVDLWTPYHQIEVAGGMPHECTPEQLLGYSTLTIDAVLFDCDESEIYERDFLRAMNERTIDIGQSSKWVAKWAPYHLAHLASVWSSTKFKLSPRALGRIRENDSPQVRALAIRYLKKHKKIENAFALIDELMCAAQETLADQMVP
jgi:hypothetical protein